MRAISDKPRETYAARLLREFADGTITKEVYFYEKDRQHAVQERPLPPVPEPGVWIQLPPLEAGGSTRVTSHGSGALG